MQLLIAVLSFAKLALLAGLLALGVAGFTTYRAQTGGGMPAESELSEVSGTLVDGRIVTVERKRKGITTTRQYFEVDLSQASGMTIKIGINGFGRIGRMVFRAAVQNFQRTSRSSASTTCSSPTTWPTC
jgi:hypothetical protein